MKHTLEEIIKELQHEVAMRKVVYEKQIGFGKMTRKVADKKIAIMQEVLSHFEDLQRKQPTQQRMF